MMSVRDATAILNEDTGIFAFLPVANFVFIVIQEFSNRVFAASILVTVLSAIIYNVLSGEPEVPSKRQVWILRGVFVTWIGLLAWSMLVLYHYFGKSLIVPEILFSSRLLSYHSCSRT